MSIRVEEFGTTKDGQKVKKYILENGKGMKAAVLNLGAVLAELHVPDKDGTLRDVVWGYEDVAGYEVNGPDLGAVVGRNANRIGGAVITIAGKDYTLVKNNGENNLHSGPDMYFTRMWKAIIADDNKVEFSLHSPDGDQGYPGNADITVSYTLTDGGELQIAYEGKADRDTIFNLTNHSYFNLDGQESDSVLEQKVWLDADAFTRRSDSYRRDSGCDGNPYGFPDGAYDRRAYRCGLRASEAGRRLRPQLCAEERRKVRTVRKTHFPEEWYLHGGLHGSAGYPALFCQLSGE